MVLFELGREVAHHHDRLVGGRLLDLHHLESTRQRGVLLEVLLVFRPRRRSDGPKLAAGERRLQQVRGVVLAGLARRRRSSYAPHR